MKKEVVHLPNRVAARPITRAGHGVIKCLIRRVLECGVGVNGTGQQALYRVTY